jgi:hypothetical protein
MVRPCLKKKKSSCGVPVAHACNQEDWVSKPAWANTSQDLSPILKNPFTKNRASGVTQGPEFKPQYHTKKSQLYGMWIISQLKKMKETLIFKFKKKGQSQLKKNYLERLLKMKSSWKSL